MDAIFLHREIRLAPEAAEEIASLTKALSEHRVFSQVNDLDSLRVFMGVHVFAVWDFMSLLKRLQADLTCTSVPWLPPEDPIAARLINEIVLQEESDICEGEQKFLSHYELYRDAMLEVGADVGPIRGFLDQVRTRGAFLVPDVFQRVGSIPGDFVVHTLETAMHGTTVQALASFVLGREEIIPGMFKTLLDANPDLREMAPTLSYYLERHISVDGDLHGPAAWKLVKRMVSYDPKKRAEFVQAALKAQRDRIRLWDRLSHRLTALNIPENQSA